MTGIYKRRLELIRELDQIDYTLESVKDDWDILNVQCSSCGAKRWAKGKVGKAGKKGNQIVRCDLCPQKEMVH